MLGDPLKRSHLFPCIGLAVLLVCCYVPMSRPALAIEGSVSNSLKRQFVKTFLKAEQGDSQAQYDVGMMYYAGRQIPQDSNLAALWITKAATQGHSQAQYFLSLMYGLGDGVTQSDENSAQWCQKAAEQGYAQAQYSLARMYSVGQGLRRDEVQAVLWFRRAAEQGHADAQCDLGMMYESGCGVKRDRNQAVSWWIKASEKGHTWSQLLLQEYMGPGSERAVEEITNVSKTDGNEQLIKSVEQDLGIVENFEPIRTVLRDKETSGKLPESKDSNVNPEIRQQRPMADSVMPHTPQEQIAETKSKALITEPDLEERRVGPTENPQKEEMTDPSALYDLGQMYYEGIGTARNYSQALKYFTVAAEQGHAEAQYKLGVMYSFGYGVLQDSSRAAEWFAKSAEQGLPAAQYSLGVMYGTGQGVSLDPAAAVQWYTKAAEQGSVAAQFMLGLVYSKGQGVTRDSSVAVQWYTKAAEQGSPSAQYILGVIYDKGQGLVPQNDEEAVKWYTLAAQTGHADAQSKLAVRYANGTGVEKDFIEAYKWCLLAGLNNKEVTRLEQWLEARMTDSQLEEARRLARNISDSSALESLH